MSDTGSEPPPGEPPPRPAPAPDGPSGGAVIFGSCLILFGLCGLLLGGGCTLLILADLGSSSGMGGLNDLGFFLLLSLVVLAAGVVTIRAGLKMFKS